MTRLDPLLSVVAILCALFGCCCCFWLSPDYWISVHKNGRIAPGRSSAEFIAFAEHEYIGYWIGNEHGIRVEAFGLVHPAPETGKGDRFCGLFASIWANRSRQMCGGFRVLAQKRGANLVDLVERPFEFVPSSAADPAKAVEYLDWAIARTKSEADGHTLFGGANLRQRVAHFPQNGSDSRPLITISFDAAPRDYVDRVQILQRSRAFDKRDLFEEVGTYPPPPAEASTTTQRPVDSNTQQEASGVEPEELAAKKLEHDGEETTTATSTAVPSEYLDDDYLELSGAGVEWGSLGAPGESVDDKL